MRLCLVVSGTEAVSCGFFLSVSSPGERCSSVLRLASIDESESASELARHTGTGWFQVFECRRCPVLRHLCWLTGPLNFKCVSFNLNN